MPEPVIPLREFVVTWLRVGLLSFGGPAGQIALMHRIVLDEKRWIDERSYLAALNLCMVLPGPEAQQLATWCGWRLRGALGGVIAGGLFVLPGALLMMLLAALYVLYGKTTLGEGLFFGIKAVVAAIVLQALHKLAKRALKRRLDWALAAAGFVALFFFNLPFPLVVLAAGLIGASVLRGVTHAPDSPMSATVPLHRSLRVLLGLAGLWLAPVVGAALVLGPDHVLTQAGAFFARMAVVTFGGAYAVLGYVAQQAVETYHWLTPAEMLDGLGLAETTPGPLVLVLQFVGFLAGAREFAGVPPMVGGALVAMMTLWCTFVPSFMWIFALAPQLDRMTRLPRLQGALAGVTAAVVGVVLNLSVWFALHVLFARVETLAVSPLRLTLPDWTSLDTAAALLMAAAALALLRFKAGMLATLGTGAVVGLGLRVLAG